MSGFGLFAGALSHAASDTLKGLREGEEERRKEEEAGRRNRAEQMNIAAFPLEYQGLNLRNQSAQQNMDINADANLRAWANERRLDSQEQRLQGQDRRAEEAHGWQRDLHPIQARLLGS